MMLKRAVASCLFLAGGLVTWFALSFLQGYSASQAAMSAGPVSGAPGLDAVALWLFCSYFLVSAVSAIATSRKSVLWVLWMFAHALVALAFCVLCLEAFGWGGEKFVLAILALLAITAAFFAPWLAIWAWLLMRAGPDIPTNP